MLYAIPFVVKCIFRLIKLVCLYWLGVFNEVVRWYVLFEEISVKFISLIFCLCLAVIISSCNGSQVEKTQGKHKAEIQIFLDAHLTLIKPDINSVFFGSDGVVGIQDVKGVWQKEFVLKQGDTFLTQPDEHASSTFEVAQIKPESVVLKYTSTFDHSSFGKKVISIDEGEIEIQYKNNK